MITAIREVRRARGMTLDEVARACRPPTTAQTIGRLETGMRTVSIGWLNRIAAALGVTAAELVTLPDRTTLDVVATLDGDGAHATRHATTLTPPVPTPELVAMTVAASVGDYRAGDAIWCERLAPADFGRALNRDILVPRGAGRYLFGRLLDREGAKLHLLPLGPAARQQVIADAPWLARAVKLVRSL